MSSVEVQILSGRANPSIHLADVLMSWWRLGGIHQPVKVDRQRGAEGSWQWEALGWRPSTHSVDGCFATECV